LICTREGALSDLNVVNVIVCTYRSLQFVYLYSVLFSKPMVL
jgi:hypothetical protein